MSAGRAGEVPRRSVNGLAIAADTVDALHAAPYSRDLAVFHTSFSTGTMSSCAATAERGIRSVCDQISGLVLVSSPVVADVRTGIRLVAGAPLPVFWKIPQ